MCQNNKSIDGIFLSDASTNSTNTTKNITNGNGIDGIFLTGNNTPSSMTRTSSNTRIRTTTFAQDGEKTRPVNENVNTPQD